MISLGKAHSVTDLLVLLPPLATAGRVVPFEFGGHERLLINDPELVHYVLGSHDFEMRQSPASGPALKVMGDGLLTTRSRERWTPRRRAIQHQLAPSQIGAYSSTILSNTHEMIDAWTPGSEISVRDEILTLALDNLGDALFGSDFRDFRTTVRTALDLMVDLFDRAETGRPDLDADEALDGAIDELEDFVETVVDRRAGTTSSRSHVVDVLIAAASSDDPVFQDPFLRDEAITLLMAGHDTVAFLMNMSIYLVEGHPEVKERLAREVGEALASGLTDEKLVSALPYVQQVARETLRLFPPLPFFNRTATEGLVLDGQAVPAGTLLMASPWLIHRDSRYWDRPEQFDPSRFDPERRSDIPRYVYFPFGHGQRVCAGNHFAMLQCALVVSLIAARADLSFAVTGTPEISCPVTLKFADPLRAAVTDNHHIIRSGRNV